MKSRLLAPTGRAAKVLSARSSKEAFTIHKQIYRRNSKVDEFSGMMLAPNLHTNTVFIVDEASMIASTQQREEGAMFISDNSLLSDLIAFVKNGNPLNKIIFLGDKNQLPPVNEIESKALSGEYLQQKFKIQGKSYLLTEVKRQEDGSLVLKNASNIRLGIESNVEKVNLIGVEKKSVSQASTDYVREYLSNGTDSVISIGATHKMNKMFNGVVREKIYGFNANVVEVDDLLLITTTWKRNDYQLYSGDHVVVSEINHNQIEMVAGLHFIPVKLLSKSLQGTEEIIEDYILLESILHPEGLKPEQENRLRHERFSKNKIYRESLVPSDDRYVGAIRASYGHSITCNKAQGGEWDKVFINSYFMPTLKYQYTAVTRAKTSLVLY